MCNLHLTNLTLQSFDLPLQGAKTSDRNVQNFKNMTQQEAFIKTLNDKAT